MDLNEITLFGQPYTLYVAIFMIMLIVIKSEEIPKEVAKILVLTTVVLILIFFSYVIYQIHYN